MGDYCSFTKAVEQLGDRWSLVIVREMLLHGDRGFTDLVTGVSGISRSVLAARLRKMRDLGLVESVRGPAHATRYRLTPAGLELGPMLHHLRAWADRFLPEDPAMIERDPDIVIPWLARRVDVTDVPDRPVVLEIALSGGRRRQFWLVLERDVEPSVCITDPLMGADRYVFLESDVGSLSLVSRGLRDWSAAIGDGSVRLSGEPAMLDMLPTWFVAPRGVDSARPLQAAR
jgi:DNA-binding HxlR family transcriptional regulator